MSKMLTPRPLAAGTLAAALLLPLAAGADDAADFAAAVTGGEASASVRYRYEFVDQDSASLVDDQANASTARLRLNYRTGQWRGWSLFGEFDYVGHLFVTDFDSAAGTSPDKQGVYPVVADPKGADLNQLYIDAGPETAAFRFGRQRILLDNQRFVGHVGWRQNEQTFDALTFSTNAAPQGRISYTYLNRVRRIFGDRSPAGTDRVDGHLLNGKFKVNDSWSLTPYVYYLDYQDPGRFASSSATLGLRLAGGLSAGDGKLTIAAELARQSDVGDNPLNYDANYVHAEVLWAPSDLLTVGLGLESLGSDSGNAGFQTPLATLHKFQGWADKFLATPAGGIDDVYASVSFKASGWTFTGVYHDFSAESGGGSYGTEFDLSAAHKLTDNYSVLLKGALFDGDAAAFTDTTKFWLMFTASY